MNPGGTRIFRIRAGKNQSFKTIPEFYARNGVSSSGLYTDIITRHNQIVVMGGRFQEEFKHEIPVEKSNLNAERISITCRMHKN